MCVAVSGLLLRGLELTALPASRPDLDCTFSFPGKPRRAGVLTLSLRAAWERIGSLVQKQPHLKALMELLTRFHEAGTEAGELPTFRKSSQIGPALTVVSSCRAG